MKISALMLAKNEEAIIEDCLKRLNFADEIIVLDQNSCDKTAKIALNYTNKVIQSSKDEFATNRNLLKDYAKGEWLLYVDADEIITNDLEKEIMETVKKEKHQAYYLPRANFVLGRRLNHGGWHPDYVPRLFKKSTLNGWEGLIHESPIVNGSFGYLKQPLIHNTARSMTRMLEKTIKWASIEAGLSFKAGHPSVNIAKVIKNAAQEFASRYFLKLGILDGVVGLIESIFQSLHKIIVLTYLWELQQGKKKSENE